LREVEEWLSGAPDPGRFPYAAVLTEFHRTGKHAVAKELLVLLDQVRRSTPPHTRFLRDFLDVALDKFDGRYDYQTYLGLSLLPLPEAEGVRTRHDELIVQLVADALGFELAAATGATGLLPRQRPTSALVDKRYRLGLRTVAPVLAGLGVPMAAESDPAVAVLRLRALTTARLDSATRLALAASMQPVDVVHDEYLFIRVLQGYESTFAALAAELGQAVDDLGTGRVLDAAERLAYGRNLLDRSAPLFSLMATVQTDSFRTFRVHTEGASAIQSRSYKRVESLCRVPDESRLDSMAYRSVPEVRHQVLAGQPSLDEAYRAAGLTDGERGLLDQRMTEFSTALLQWRQTHYRIAVRMLGTRPGTGYTEGTPYLAAVRDIPVFSEPGSPRASRQECSQEEPK